MANQPTPPNIPSKKCTAPLLTIGYHWLRCRFRMGGLVVLILGDSCTLRCPLCSRFQPGPTTVPHRGGGVSSHVIQNWWGWYLTSADVVFAQCQWYSYYKYIYIYLYVIDIYIYHVFLKILNCLPSINETWFSDVFPNLFFHPPMVPPRICRGHQLKSWKNARRSGRIVLPLGSGYDQRRIFDSCVG